jgi:hypothetical protein
LHIVIHRDTRSLFNFNGEFDMMQSFLRYVGFWGLGGFLAVFSSSAFAYDAACMDRNLVLPINNQQVVSWKLNRAVPNGWKGRANVEGIVLGVFPDRNDHDHFVIQIGPNPNVDVIEVVYNSDFGALPNIQRGMRVHACGDYIKSVAQNGPYPPSPAGAIVHWVHQNPNGNGHEHGYLTIDNVMYGIGPDQGRGNPQGQRRRR